MEYYVYKFNSDLIPNRLTLHSLLTSLFDKKIENIDFRIENDFKIIYLKTNVLINGIKENYSFFDFEKNKKINIKYLGFKDVVIENIKEGSLMALNGLVEYSIEIKREGKNKNICPFFMGRFIENIINPENNQILNPRLHFKTILENRCGVKIESMKNEYFNRLPIEIISKKISLKNLIYIDVPVIVTDEILFNSLLYRSIFKKKSYGLGNINIY